MDKIIKVALQPIGKFWDEYSQKQLDSLLSRLPERFQVFKNPPASEEVQVISEIEKVLELKPDLLLLAALHGGTARPLVLAARKANIPTAIWCHDRNHSLASSSLAIESLRQLDHKCYILHGDGQEIKNELVSIATAGAVIKKLSITRICKMGLQHFNLIGTEINPLIIHKKFGSWIVPLTIKSILDKMDNIDSGTCSKFISEMKENYSLNVGDKLLKKSVKFHLALKEVSEEQKLDIITLDCWNEFLSEIPLCLGFIKEDYRIACEGDTILALLLIAGEVISGKPGFTGDFYSLNEETNEAVFMHCGGCSQLHCLDNKIEIVEQSSPAVSGKKTRVVACHPVLKAGNGIIALLHGANLDKLHLRRCEIIRTDFSDQMKAVVRIEGDSSIFRKGVSGNHYTIFQGDHYDCWKLWACWAGISIH